MPNPLYNALGGNRQPDMMADFRNFVQQMQGRGVNPYQEINRLVQSGQVTQQQLNQAQQMAHQLFRK
ncbi:MAG: hypothetical protein J6B95_08245 [Oscillospiraceae bacterium]|nr:hypothetical protein [Oscillospiraceae bacterium]